MTEPILLTTTGTGTAAIGDWRGSPTKAATFRLGKAFSLAPLAEGPALAKLAELQSVAHRIEVALTFEVPRASHETAACAAESPFDSLFVLALLHDADFIEDPRGDVTDLLATALWKRVRESGGHIGTGRRRAIVVRDPDYIIPPCLSLDARFPYPDQFRSLLQTAAAEMSGEATYAQSTTEGFALTFLYESLLNSHEHGRLGINGQPVMGIRGIVIEKLHVTSLAEVARRHDLPTYLREYVVRHWPSLSRHHSLMAFTIVDRGQGIQATLPPANGDETEWRRLTRAFSLGESRKPRGSDIHVGEGLPMILDAGRRLKALLVVHSGSLSAFADLDVAGTTDALTSLPGSIAQGGTSITLAWPHLAASPDQLLLFDAAPL